MKKTIALLLALLLVAGTVFAEVIDITGGGSHQYNMYLQAVVEDGGGLDNGDGDDPSDIKNGGLYIMVGYNYKNSYKDSTTGEYKSYTMGSSYTTGDLEDLGAYDTSNPLTVSLTPENDNDKTGTLQFYVAAKSNASKKRSTQITFASNGFTKQEEAGEEQQSNKPIGITFAGKSKEYTGNGLTANAATEGGTITVSADKGSYQKDYIYVARTDASWNKDASLAAGTYTATITVTVTATE